MKNKKKFLFLIIPLVFIMSLFLLFGCDNDKQKKGIRIYDTEKTLLKELPNQEQPVTINDLLSYDGVLKDKHFVYKVELERENSKSEILDKTIPFTPPFNLYVDQRPYSDLETLDPGKRLIDLSGVSVENIQKVLMEHNIAVTVQFIYEKQEGAAGAFIGYVGYEIGDLIKPNQIIQIKISAPLDVELPNLLGKTKEEAKAALLELQVPEKLINFMSDNMPSNLDSSFQGSYVTGYSNVKAGDLYEIDEENGRYIYINCYENYAYTLNENILKLNKYELDLNPIYKTNVEPTYEIDNTKEADTLCRIEFLDKENGTIVKTVNLGEGFESNDSRQYNMRHVYYTVDDAFYGYTEENKNIKELYISKVLHQSKGARAVELYNSTDLEIDLSEYKISIIEHGEFTPEKEIILSGKLKAKTTFLIINKSANALNNLSDYAELISTDLTFNALDIIQLRKVSNNTYYDTINNIGISNTNIMEDELLIRREKELYRSIGAKKFAPTSELYPLNHGSRNFMSDYFVGYISTFYEPLKAKKHPYIDTQTFDFNAFKQLNYGIKEFWNGGISKVDSISHIADGDTAHFKIGSTLYKIRYYDIDTPEVGRNGAASQTGADEAYEANKTLINKAFAANELYIAVPHRGMDSLSLDTYGRQLGFIFGKVDGEYVCFNLEMVKQGWIPDEPKYKPEGFYANLIINNRYMYQLIREAAYNARSNGVWFYG